METGTGAQATQEQGSLRVRLALGLDQVSRWSLWLIALFVMVVVPWFFGGMGPEGYWFTVWAGRACLLPLGLWAVSSILRRRKPPVGFWVAVVCWGLLAVQVWVSMGNVSQVPIAPWAGQGFDPVSYNTLLPSSAFWGATQSVGRTWVSFGLLLLSTYCVGLRHRQLKLLLWLFVVNVAVLAALGIPFKYSGDYLMLGRWQMPENYFFSTFIYHNHWCAYALLGLAATIGIGFQTHSIWSRVLLTLFAAFLVLSAPVSVSRLGTLFMLGFLSFAFGVWYLRRGMRVPMKDWRLVVTLVVSALLVVGAVVFSVSHLGGRVVGQRTWSYIIKQNPFGSRVTLVVDSVPMVCEKPLFGWGLGAFGAAFRKFQRPESIIVYNEGRETRYEHCHNDWMERLVELGAIGFSLLLLPFFVWVRGRGEVSPPDRRLFFWISTGVVFVLVFALGDMVLCNLSVAGSLATLGGLICSTMRSSESGKSLS